MVRSSSESALRNDLPLVVLAVLLVIALAVGFGGVGALFGLVWLLGSVAVTLAFLYLLYRLVLAGERIADAQERRARAAEGDTGGTATRDDTSADARLDEFAADDRTGSDGDPDTGGD